MLLPPRRPCGPVPDVVAGSRRAYGMALALLAVGGVIIVLGYGMTWATATVGVLPGSTEATRELSVSGRDLYPGAAITGWVALAGVAGILATRSAGRTIVAALMVLAGALAAGVAVWFAVDMDRAVTSGVADVVRASGTVAWLLPVAGGLLVVGAGIATVRRGRHWPAMGARYERTGARTRRSDWDVQDAGQDPTDDLVE